MEEGSVVVVVVVEVEEEGSRQARNVVEEKASGQPSME